MHRTSYACAALAGMLLMFGCNEEEEEPPSWVWMAPRPDESGANAASAPTSDFSSAAVDDEPEEPVEPEAPGAYEARLEAARVEGRRAAAESVAAGRPEFRAGGMPGYGGMFYRELLADELGVGMRNTGCTMSMEGEARERANNEAVSEWIAGRFGPHALERLQARAEALGVRYRGREEEWATERRARLGSKLATKVRRQR